MLYLQVQLGHTRLQRWQQATILYRSRPITSCFKEQFRLPIPLWTLITVHLELLPPHPRRAIGAQRSLGCRKVLHFWQNGTVVLRSKTQLQTHTMHGGRSRPQPRCRKYIGTYISLLTVSDTLMSLRFSFYCTCPASVGVVCPAPGPTPAHHPDHASTLPTGPAETLSRLVQLFCTAVRFVKLIPRYQNPESQPTSGCGTCSINTSFTVDSNQCI